MTQRDVVLRWIEQVAAVVRRILLGPGPRDIELARKHVEDALAQHLGSLALVIPKLDPESAASLLHDPDRLSGLALLLDLQASVEEADHNSGPAAELRERAAAFRRMVAGETDRS